MTSEFATFSSLAKDTFSGSETPYKDPVRAWPGAYLVENVRLAGAGDPTTIDEQLQAVVSERGSQSNA